MCAFLSQFIHTLDLSDNRYHHTAYSWGVVEHIVHSPFVSDLQL